MVRRSVQIAGAALLAAFAACGAQGQSSPAQDEVFSPGMPGITLPEPTYRFDPEYTMEARQAGLQGTVRLSMIIDLKGIPQDITVRRPLGMGLDERAMETVAQWRFRPAMKDGSPVKFRASVEISFRLWRKGWSITNISFPEQPGVSPPVIARAPLAKDRSADPGLFRLTLRVDEAGAPADVGIAMSSNPALDRAAVSSVRNWHFRPAMENGQPVSVTGTIELSFNPEAARPKH